MKNYHDKQAIFHEIKNSITIIECTFKLLSDSRNEIYYDDLLCDALEEINSLNHMISAFMPPDEAPCEPEPISIETIVSDVTHELYPLIMGTNFNCKFTLADNLPLLFVDAGHLKTCILNLIYNASEAMKFTGTAFINITDDKNRIRIDIKDFGGGISKEQEAHIFEMFYSSKINGTGLGLPHTKQLVSEMGGDIFYTSRPGDGCTFSLQLPIFIKNE